MLEVADIVGHQNVSATVRCCLQNQLVAGVGELRPPFEMDLDRLQQSRQLLEQAFQLVIR